MNWNLLDEQWRERHDKTAFAELEATLDKALFNSGEVPEYALVWRWAKLSHFRAMLAREEGKKEEAARHFAAGAQEAETAVKLQPNRVEGNFWRGVCLIEAARLQGSLSALRTLFPAAKFVERATRIDEEYHFAGPLRVQGRIWQQKPLVAGGNLDRALDFYRRALQIAPQNSTTLFYYADALIANQDRPEARKVLAQIIEAPRDEDWVWEQARDKQLAAARLEEIAIGKS